MPGQRAPGQKLVPVPMTQEFIDTIDAALPRLGYSDRAKFIRDAVYEKLNRMGQRVPVELSIAPGRTAKGPKPLPAPGRIVDKRGMPLSSKVASVAATASGAAIAEARSANQGSRRSPRVDAPSDDKPSPRRGGPSRSKPQPATPKQAPK